jgi:hypothetical protein
MNFLRSRLTLVGALLAVPFAQLSGCNVKEREYAPVDDGGSAGTGGSSAGKGGSKSSGGTSGKGGRGGGGTGGNGAEGGEGTGTSGSGGEDSGGTSGQGSGGRGGSSQGGSSGEGGDDGSGGTSGSDGGSGAGEGGADTGGSGGAGTGGGGTGSGGAGTGGGGTSSGGAGTSSGGAGSGGAGTGGGGTGGAGTGGGGNGGSGGGTVCVPTSSTESNCADGADNDCNGVTDCLTPDIMFPAPNGAAAGEHVEYRFQAPHSSATFECRRVRGNVAGGTWGACPRLSGAIVFPFPNGVSSNPAANDGLWTTEVRLSFPNGSKSNVFSRMVYIHSSLVSAARCQPLVSDQAYFDLADDKLQMAGAFVDSTIRAPFVSIDFDPPISAKYSVASTDGTINVSSLRHRFSFNANKQMMLMTRTYTSRLGAYGCNALEKRVHTQPGSWVFAGTMTYQLCTGIVFNKKGAGICINASGGAAVLAEHVRQDYGVQVQAPDYSPEADNFAWRKLRAQQIAGFNVAFSPKCDDTGCNSTNPTILFLPDKGFFSYWRD